MKFSYGFRVLNLWMSLDVVPSSGGSVKQASAAVDQLHYKFNKAIPN